MKTLCFSLGLLLLAVCCCNAMPKAILHATTPGECCFKFSDRALPSELVADINKTHLSCWKKAFIVQTVRNRKICYSQSSQWALDTYNKLHNTEGSGHH
ncbi:C-C motif chemokine 3-like 1 [Odontesthes bonariensis]|uniref:C-C motif chemokine 3-like 1 n=1 Tax=Odontesthes bonariensis TaxID=219752 RepID=UPI003F5811E9